METYSYSKIRNFNECRYGFYRNYFDKDRDKLNHGTSEFGSFSHEILEKYAKGELEDYEMLPYYLQHYDENVVSSFNLIMSENFSRDFSADYFKSGEEYFKNFNGFENLKILEAEYEFTEPIEDKFYITGKVDLIAEDCDGNLIIIDHKSKSKFKNKTEKEEYSKQLYLYAFAVNKKYGKFPNQLMFNMFRKSIWEKFDFDKEKYDDTLQWIKDEVTEIENCVDFYPVCKGFYCDNFCPYRCNCDRKQ